MSPFVFKSILNFVLASLFIPSIIGILPSFGLSVHFTNLLINDVTVDANLRNEIKGDIIMLYVGIFLAVLSTALILRINHRKMSIPHLFILALSIGSLALIGVGASKLANENETLKNNEAYKGFVPSVSAFAILFFIITVCGWTAIAAEGSEVFNA